MGYKFYDTTTRQSSSRTYSMEGFYTEPGGEFEGSCPGVEVLYARGRESLSPELSTIQSAGDGSIYKGRRYPERIITVGFVLRADDEEDFREKWNNIAKFLTFENVKIYFYDEEDKYFIGTAGEISEIEGGKLHVKGEVQILCTDPFKYSDTEYDRPVVAVGEATDIHVNYKGSAPCYPVLEFRFHEESGSEATPIGNCGFVSVTNEDGYEIYFGDENDTKGATGSILDRPLSLVLLNSWKTTTPRGLREQNDAGFHPEDPSFELSGYLTQETVNSKTVFSGYGTGTKEYNGQGLLIPLPEIPTGYTKNWLIGTSLYFNKYAGTGGMFNLSVLDEDQKCILSLYIERQTQERYYVTFHACATYYNFEWLYTNITEKEEDLFQSLEVMKIENKFILKLGSKTEFSFMDDSNAADDFKKARYIYMGFYTSGTTGVKCPVSIRNRVYARYLSQDRATFTTNNTLTVDCSDGTILLNGVEHPEYGNIRNAWSKFALKPDPFQKWTLRRSSWCDTYYPTLHVKYREKYL